MIQKPPYWSENDALGHVEQRKFNLTCPSVSFALQYGDFVPRDCSPAKGPLVIITEILTMLCQNALSFKFVLSIGNKKTISKITFWSC